MAYDGKLLARARDRLVRQREERARLYEQRLAQVYDSIPEIRLIDGRLRDHMTTLARLTLEGPPDLAARLDALRRENLDLQMRRTELMEARGFPSDYLEQKSACPRCGDTGSLPGGGVCQCLDALYKQELTRELGVLLRNGDERFERFDLGYYSDQLDPETGKVPRQSMEKVLTICRRYAAQFPKGGATNLLFQGGPGLGKTYLSACIARETADRGFSVCYDSAGAALEHYERQRFGKEQEVQEAATARIRQMEHCDLLILDDLGTELHSPQNQSALYRMLNDRLTAKRPMIVSTNLDDEALLARYGSQIHSRLLGEFARISFIGRDIRQIKKGN